MTGAFFKKKKKKTVHENLFFFCFVLLLFNYLFNMSSTNTNSNASGIEDNELPKTNVTRVLKASVRNQNIPLLFKADLFFIPLASTRHRFTKGRTFSCW
jgi:hypothetical protein